MALARPVGLGKGSKHRAHAECFSRTSARGHGAFRAFAYPAEVFRGADVREALAVHTRCALVGAALGIGMRQDVLAADLVVQGVEAIPGFCLRFRVQRRLQSELIGCPISRSLTTYCVRLGRVENWRASLGRSLYSLLSRPFVCECHTISTVPRFQPPPRRTQRADFPHYALLFASPQGLCDLSCRSDFRL
jgi:hypothetical protein